MTIIYLTKQHHTLIVPQSSLFPLLLMGLLTGVGMLVGWQGLAILDPTFVAFLKRFEPVLVILLSLFYLKERLFVGEIVSIILIALGGVWSAFGRWEVIGEGVILIMLASLATALQLFIAKTNIQNVSPLILVFYRISIATCAIALWTIFSGGVNI